MKRADLIVSAILALFSIYLMVKSAELPVGWLPGEGPGGGAFPFWLALAMLICSVLIFLRNVMRLSVEGRATEIFMDREAVRLFVVVLISLSAMIGLIHIIGVYFSVPLFMVFYMRWFGGHSWKKTISVAVTMTVGTFILFEKILLIILPKGLTESWFYIFY